MRKYARCAAVAGAALIIASAGAGAGAAVADAGHHGPVIPASCIAPLNGGAYRSVPDGDAERYDTGVYVCANGAWVLDPDYGQ